MTFHFVTVMSWIEVVITLLILFVECLIAALGGTPHEKKWWDGVIMILNFIAFPLALAWLITIHYWG